MALVIAYQDQDPPGLAVPVRERVPAAGSAQGTLGSSRPVYRPASPLHTLRTPNASALALFSAPQKDLHNRMRQLVFARHACQRVEQMLAAVVSRGASEEELNCINLLRTWMLAFVETPVATQHWHATCTRVNTILAGSQGLEELLKEYCHICEADILSTLTLPRRYNTTCFPMYLR